MKRKILVILIFLIYAVGVGFVLYPQVADVVVKQKQSKAVESFEHKETRDAVYEEMVSYNQSLIQNGQAGLSDAWIDTEMSSFLETSGYEEGMVGVLNINAMGVSLPLYIGADEENLMKGAAVLANTSMPIGGESTNCVIAGHRGGYNGQAVFRDIEVLQAGDVVTVTNAWETLEYEVVKSIVIMPDDIDAIKIIPGADMLTLVTCHPYGDNTQRYVVYCTRRGSDTETITNEIEDGIPYTTSGGEIALERNLYRIGTGAAVVVFVILAAILIRKK